MHPELVLVQVPVSQTTGLTTRCTLSWVLVQVPVPQTVRTLGAALVKPTQSLDAQTRTQDQEALVELDPGQFWSRRDRTDADPRSGLSGPAAYCPGAADRGRHRGAYSRFHRTRLVRSDPPGPSWVCTSGLRWSRPGPEIVQAWPQSGLR
ncbi:hypothetical protein WMY93_033983 [Mugilogobius chulae]|uniref:Uncharacterized protein n=1 Tax=Mugilogobius chulae TaxID=88201 RepID=A0AAW0MIJ0_9GOBI